MGFALYTGDCREVMPKHGIVNLVDAVVTDPPYGLEFMGKGWDRGVPGVEFWEAVMAAMKPGAHLLAFGGTRTFHRLTCAIEDAGFEIRDCLMWVYGSGFPKSLDVSKAIDKRGGNSNLSAQIGKALQEARQERKLTVGWCDREFCGGTTNWSWFEGRPAGQRVPTPETFTRIAEAWPEVSCLAEMVAEVEREIVGKSDHLSGIGNAVEGHYTVGGTKAEYYDVTVPATEAAKQWEGFGTALKPAWEPVILARKPLVGTVANNVLEHGVGGLNIDGCRVGTEQLEYRTTSYREAQTGEFSGQQQVNHTTGSKQVQGRWPANLIHDGSGEVVELFPESKVSGTAKLNKPTTSRPESATIYGEYAPHTSIIPNDSGSAARFFYTAKASKKERGEGNNHPTIKPLQLMRYLCRLITPPRGLILDPFMGSGSTLVAATLESFHSIGIDTEPNYVAIAHKRIREAIH